VVHVWFEDAVQTKSNLTDFSNWH